MFDSGSDGLTHGLRAVLYDKLSQVGAAQYIAQYKALKVAVISILSAFWVKSNIFVRPILGGNCECELHP